MPTSKIEKIEKINKWEGRRGTVFYMTVRFENGDVGEIGKTHIEGLLPGMEITYRLEDAYSKNNKPYKKIIELPSQNDGDRRLEMARSPHLANHPAAPLSNGAGLPNDRPLTSFALAWAKDILAAKYHGAKEVSMEQIKGELFNLADANLNWLTSNS